MKLELQLTVEVEDATVEAMQEAVLRDVFEWLNSEPVMEKLSGFTQAAKDGPERVMSTNG
jgi:hypothetical protein